MGDTVNIVHPSTPGRTYSIPVEKLSEAESQGFLPESGGQAAGRVGEAAAEDAATSASGKLGATATAGLAGLTFGASDLAFHGAKELRDRNPGLSLAANLAGGVISGGLASKVGAAAGGLVKGEGALAQLGRAAVANTAEGATIGAGQGVSELGLSDDPITLEHAASVLSSNMLFGGVVGGGVGTLGKAAELGLQRAKGALDGVVERSTKIAGVPDDLAAMDAKGLRAARDAEVEQLATGHAADRVAAKSDAVDEALKYRTAVADANPYLVTGEGSASAPFAKSSRTLRNAMDDVEGLREAPGSLLKPLRQQAQAIEKTLAERVAIEAKFAEVNGKIAKDIAEDLATLPDSATHVELTGKAAKRYGAFADVKVGKGAVQVAREDAQQFADALADGSVHGEGQAALDKLGGLLEQNKGLQAKLKAATGPALSKAELVSDRLTAIDAARDALATPGAKKTLAEEMVGGTVFHHVSNFVGGAVGAVVGGPIGGLVGSLAGGAVAKGVQGAVFGKLGKAAAEAAARTSKAIDTFLTVGAKVAPVAVPAATRVLTAVRYAATDKKEHQPTDLVGAFQKRSAELKSQTMYDETGATVMRPEARQALAKQLSPIRAAAPVVADRLESLAARRLEFLSSKLPRRPDVGGIPTGPDTWQPSDMAMRTFARYAHAAEDPSSVEERLGNGTLSPEDVEAYRAVYPERAAQMQQDILGKLASLKKQLPYQKRLALSMFTGVAVDPAMSPEILSALQMGFAVEPNTNGGTQAPTPQPQFGSLSKSSTDAETPAQERALGSRG